MIKFLDKNELVLGGGDWELAPFKFSKILRLGGGFVEPTYRDVILSGNTSLTLVNSKANGLNYVKLFGATEQHNLPSEYTQVEYLESTGTQYIDTGKKLDTSKTYTLEFQFTDLVYSGAFWGARADATIGLKSVDLGGSGSSRFYMYCTSTDYSSRVASSQYRQSTGSQPFDTKKHKFVFNGVYGVYKFDNIDMIPGSSGTVSTESYETDNNAFLFCTNGGGVATQPKNMKIYSYIVEGEMNLIPCRRKSDSVLGLYDTVTGTFLTNAGTGTFTAGSDVVPTPETPMDIVCNNGILKVSPNLYDENKVTDVNTYYNSVGTLGIGSSGDRFKLLQLNVTANDNYTFSWQENVLGTANNSAYIRVSCFNASDGFITRLLCHCYSYPDKVWTITIPDDTAYIDIRICSITSANRQHLEGVQIEKGSTATAYRPYGEIYVDGHTQTINVHGKNLFDYEFFYDNYQRYSASNVGRCLIKLKPNTQYVVSTNKNSSVNNALVFAVAGSDISFSPNTSANGVLIGLKRKITTDNNGYLCIGIYVLGEEAISKSDFVDGSMWVQIEQATASTAYEPYFYGGSATAEMLLAVDSYKDEQDILSGAITRNIGIKVFDGTENWELHNSENSVFRLDNIFTNLAQGVPVLQSAYCTHLTLTNTYITSQFSNNSFRWSATVYSGAIVDKTNGTRLYVKLGDISSIEDLKQFLSEQYASGTPVIIVYPLATPINEKVTPQPLSIQAGNNVIEITQASIDNLPLKVCYKAGVEVTIKEVQKVNNDNQVEVTING